MLFVMSPLGRIFGLHLGLVFLLSSISFIFSSSTSFFVVFYFLYFVFFFFFIFSFSNSFPFSSTSFFIVSYFLYFLLFFLCNLRIDRNPILDAIFFAGAILTCLEPDSLLYHLDKKNTASYV